jgi:hypothetical protein
MEKLKPCRCGETELDFEFESCCHMHGCLIGCMNLLCEEKPVIAFGLTKASAEKRAVKKWNRRANDVR